MNRNFSRIPFLAVLITAVHLTAAQAETVIGTITAEFDGARIDQSTVRAGTGAEAMSTASVRRQGMTTSISIYSARTPQISVELMYGGSAAPGPDTPAMLASVNLFPKGFWPHWSSEEAPMPVSVTFDVLDLSGPVGRAEGRFEGVLCYVETQTSEADAANCKPISGSFATELHDESG